MLTDCMGSVPRVTDPRRAARSGAERVAGHAARAPPRNLPAWPGLVGATGFEPATTCTPSRCATRLRYAPKFPVTRPFPSLETALERAAILGAAARARQASVGRLLPRAVGGSRGAPRGP